MEPPLVRPDRPARVVSRDRAGVADKAKEHKPDAVVRAAGAELRRLRHRLRQGEGASCRPGGGEPLLPQSASGGGDRTVWSIRSPRVPVVARASFEIPGLGALAAQARID